MAYEDMRVSNPANNVHIESRERITVTGVTEVGSVNEQEVQMGTALGRLTVRGSSLHMEKLSVDSGDVLILGSIDGVEYEEAGKQGGFFSRIFR